MQMHDQIIRAWRIIRKNRVARDFFSGCYYALNNVGTRFNDTFPFHYTYSVGMKTAKESGKTYCIIKWMPNFLGTFETWMWAAFMAMVALGDGYIPVVDLREYQEDSNKIYKDFSEGKTNFWDIFFNQYQREVSLEEVYQSGDYVVLSRIFYQEYVPTWATYKPSQIIYESYRKMYQKMGINRQVLHAIGEKELPKRTLGITIRRNMEWGNRLGRPLYVGKVYHHARTHLQAYERWISENLHCLGFDRFFVAADDRAAVEYFQEKFGEKCICADRKLPRRFDGDRPLNIEIEAEKKVFYQEFSDDPAVRAKETEMGYISETLLLSKCDALLPNRMTQEMMARVMAEKNISLIDNDIFLDMFYWR